MERDDVHELIAAYALDALDEREEAEYEAHLGRCAACQAELGSLQDAASLLAYAPESPAPPAALRSRILERARAERTNVVPLRRQWAFRGVAAAAAVAAVAAIALGVWATSLSSDLESERDARGGQTRAARALADPNAARFPLQGGSGTLVVSGTNGALILRGLRPAPGKIYAAWVSADGKTMLPAGTFRPDPDDETIFGLTRPVPPGGLVAVTVQDRPTAEPTSPPLLTAQT